MKRIIPRDPSARNAWFISFFINLSVALFLAVIYFRLPPKLPLFYSRPSGEEQLVNSLYIFLPSLSSIVFSIINLLVGKFLADDWYKNIPATKRREHTLFLLRILASFSLLATILASITVIRIVFLVT